MYKAIILAGAIAVMAAPAFAQQSPTGQSSGGYKGNSGNAATTGAAMGGQPADSGMAKPMMKKKKMMKKKRM